MTELQSQITKFRCMDRRQDLKYFWSRLSGADSLKTKAGEKVIYSRKLDRGFDSNNYKIERKDRGNDSVLIPTLRLWK